MVETQRRLGIPTQSGLAEFEQFVLPLLSTGPNSRSMHQRHVMHNGGVRSEGRYFVWNTFCRIL